MEPVTLSSLAAGWLPLTRDYRPSAFWFWNAGMAPARMREVVEGMAGAGIREFLIHPVHGMEVEYLSPAFFDSYRLALRLARDNGLKAWVYDEFGWPSGNAGGLLLRGHPECRGWYLAFSRDTAGRVTAEPRQSDRVMDCTMGAPWTRSEAGYLDTLSVEAVRRFIDMTHERVLRECGDLFHEVIRGFFTDEPVDMVDCRTDTAGGWNACGLPWTPAFPARFRERFGYAIEPYYAELAGDGPSAMKRDYWALAKEMHVAAYHAQMGDWCRAHGVEYTGHVGEDTPLMQVRFAGSAFQALSRMDRPGVDWLGVGGIEPEQVFVPEVLVASIARHAGRPRVFCEAYGISPFSLTPGRMLRQAQIFGLHGVNDIALMGFQQALDGMRKHLYWPPLFQEAPWWPFYPELRDAFARSVGLASLGTPLHRYALLYPQNALEQADVLSTDVWGRGDPGSAMIWRLGEAVYRAGETFELVFPEVLDRATVSAGRLVMPHGEYDTLIAPSDIPFYDSSVALLDALSAAGGRLLRGTVEETEALIAAAPASWSGEIGLQAEPGAVRVFRFRYPDGTLTALRNVTDAQRTVRVTAAVPLTEWDPATGELTERRNPRWDMEPHSTRYFTATHGSLTARKADLPPARVTLDAEWMVSTEAPNLARPLGLQFRHPSRGWVDAVNLEVPGSPAGKRPFGIPADFFGETRIDFWGRFNVGAMPADLGVVFEAGHLATLSVNGKDADLSPAAPLALWDASCRRVDIHGLAHTGDNVLQGTLLFQAFETRTANDAFFAHRPLPAADVCCAGSFRFTDGAIVRDPGTLLRLTIELGTAGWPQYHGIITLAAEVSFAPALAERIRGLRVSLAGEDCVEAVLDGVTLGRRITPPYELAIPRVTAGSHRLALRVSGTSTNILDEPHPWGIRSVEWLCE